MVPKAYGVVTHCKLWRGLHLFAIVHNNCSQCHRILLAKPHVANPCHIPYYGWHSLINFILQIQRVWILNQHVEIMHGIPRQYGVSTRAIFMHRAITFHFHFRLLLNMLVIPLSMLALLPLSHSLSTVSPACAHCQPPTFPPGGRVLYLPHCVHGKSLNYCDAVCTGEKVVNISCVI